MNQYLSQKIKVVSLFAMIMVVFLHSYNIDIKQGQNILVFQKDFNWFLQNFISNGLTRIAVPLFFCISGYLFVLNEKYEISEFILKIKKRMRTLVVPYLFWSVFGILLYLLLQNLPYSQGFFTKKQISDYSFSEWIDAIFVNPIPYQLWFLRDLIIMVIISPLIYFLVKKLKLFYLVVIFLFWFFNQDSIFLSSEGLLFFSMGMFLKMYNIPIQQNILKRKQSVFIFSLWILVLLVKTTVRYYEYSDILDIALLKLSILIGIVAFWNVYDISYSSLFKNKIFEKMANYSFFIYVFHEPMLTIIKKGIFALLPKISLSYLIVYFIAPGIAIIICIILAKLLKSHLLYPYKIITGSR